MQEISVNDLPKYSPWIARLLGLEPFSKRVRNPYQVNAEYDQDKYLELLAHFYEHPDVDHELLRLYETGANADGDTCISKEGKLFPTTVSDARDLDRQTLVKCLEDVMEHTRVVVELGCGYGYNFSVLSKAYPNRTWIGGEYSHNAVTLSELLYRDCPHINIQPFNWYDDTWDVFDSLEAEAVVFTRHSIEQLPQAKPALQTMAKYKDKIKRVVHLEPIYELFTQQTSTLAQMRQAYILMNDYNTDLLATLTSMNVKIEKIQDDLIGGNPLNPTCVVQWTFS